MFQGHSQTSLLHITVFPTSVATVKLTFRGLTANLDSLTKVLDMNEWVAPESNKTDASNPVIGMVTVTTFDHSAGPFGPSAYIRAGTSSFCIFSCNGATILAM
ncbi:hypothetical protein SLA2020_265340 [Shorea laevis]